MKFINIKYLRIALPMLLGIFVLGACEDEEKAPIVTFDSATKGAYVRFASDVGERNINFFDISSAEYMYSVTFYDGQQGARTVQYDLELTYTDVNGVNSTTAPVAFQSFSAANFTADADGNLGVENISIRATDMIAAVGLTEAQINASDKFIVGGIMTLDDGSVYTDANSAAAVTADAFQGVFTITIPVICPSALAGVHTFVSTGWCGTGPVTGSAEWVTESSGVYSIPDGKYDFGAYQACYGGGAGVEAYTGSYPLGNLRINDICNVLSWTGASQWSEIYSFESISVAGPVMTFVWSNDYGEGGTVALTREGGVDWPALTN